MRKRGVLDRFVEGSSDFDGARVVIVGKGDEQYITPTCKTCNRSRVESIFEVNVSDLVKAPNKNGS